MARLRIFITVLGMTIGMAACHAQTSYGGKARNSLDEFRHSVRGEFDDFRKQAMKEYICFVRNPWKEFRDIPAVPVPKEQPVPPVIMPEEDKAKPVLDNPIVIEDIIEPVVVQPQPQPIEPIKALPIPSDRYFSFTFFGTKARVRFDDNDRIKLSGVSNNDIADALESLSDKKYDNIIADCLTLRDSLKLSDWAYIQMLKSLTDSIEGTGTNEAALMLAYLYMQSGYKTRLGSDGKKLFMLYGTKHIVFDHASYSVNGERYYGIEMLPSRMFICEATFPKERDLSLLVTTEQRFSDDRSAPRRIKSKLHKDIDVTATVNKNLLKFYETYPTSMIGDDMMTRWAMYANTPTEQHTRSELYPQLKERLRGLSQAEAVGRILNWIQTGFEYEYDDKIWGGDRAFFSEETLFYPFCDCEDRSILFTRLVRDILDLRCILVYYPGHLASAVELTQDNVNGDYIQHNGHRYIIADGTYINAPLGRTMPKMENATAKVILLDNE